ncbi:VCBS repeat-containing protein [candidate division KSB1 bacterium]|nr:VCBS repeat-containing protein [candidate division KSB1 bacterium]
MAFILLRKGVEILGRWNLENLPGEITVGSDPMDTIYITGENVFPSHFHLKQFLGEECRIFDRRDRNIKEMSGTYINKNLVMTEAIFRSGDKIFFSDYCLEIELKSGEISDVNVSQDAKAYLLAVYGPYSGNRFILDQDEVKIGRDPQRNDIVLQYLNPNNKQPKKDSSVSRRLASIYRRDGSYSISLFEGSHTEVRLNKEVMQHGETYQIISGDEIEIMGSGKSTIFRFQNEGEWSFTRPKKSGDFFIRHTQQLLTCFLVSIVLLACPMLFNAFQDWQIINQRPKSNRIILTTEINEPWLRGMTSSESRYDLDIASSPALGNVNGDDYINLVLSKSDNEIVAINCKTREEIWHASKKFFIQSPTSIVLADLNDDKTPEVIFSSNDSKLAVLDGRSGLSISKWSKQFNGLLAAAPTVEDIDGNGTKDVAVVSQLGQFYIGFNQIVQINWKEFDSGFEISSAPIFFGPKKSIKEMYVCTNESRILKINPISREYDEQTFHVNESLKGALASYGERNNISAEPVIGFVSQQTPALAAFTRQCRVIQFNLNNEERMWYEADIEPSGQTPRHTSGPLMTDLNSDGNMDVIVVYHCGIVRAYRGDGLEDYENANETIWSFQPDTTDRFIAPPALADLNKDGIADIVFGSDHGVIYVLNGKSGALIWQSPALDTPFRTSPLIGDIDGDQMVEILCMNIKKDIYKIKTGTVVFKNQLLWDQFHGSASQNAVYKVDFGRKSYFQFQMVLSVILILLASCIFYFSYKFRANRLQKTLRPYRPNPLT